jgi:hypothetical protein
MHLLYGGDAIAVFIWGDATKRRRVYHLAESAQLPVFRMGATLCARKSRLLEWIEQQEKGQKDAGSGGPEPFPQQSSTIKERRCGNEKNLRYQNNSNQ